MYQDRHIRTALYMLKRQYGGPLSVYKQLDSVVTFETGQVTVTATAYHVKRAVILPTVWKRVKSPAAPSPVGSRDVGLKSFIVDRADIPGVVLTQNDWVVYGGWRYQIEEIDASEFDAGWLITARLVVGSTSDNTVVVAANANVSPAAGADSE